MLLTNGLCNLHSEIVLRQLTKGLYTRLSALSWPKALIPKLVLVVFYWQRTYSITLGAVFHTVGVTLLVLLILTKAFHTRYTTSDSVTSFTKGLYLETLSVSPQAYLRSDYCMLWGLQAFFRLWYYTSSVCMLLRSVLRVFCHSCQLSVVAVLDAVLGCILRHCSKHLSRAGSFLQ